MTKLLKLLSKVRWEWLVRLYKKPSYAIIDNELEIKRFLLKDYYIILTFDPYSLSGAFVVLMSLLLTGKIPEWTHALRNVEPDDMEHDKFKFVEATAKGVHPSNFKEALGHAKRIGLFVPKYYQQKYFNDLSAKYYVNVGKEYDFGYKPEEHSQISCVEDSWSMLKTLPFSNDNFRCLKMLMDYEGNLIPQFFSCPDFKEVKRWEAS